MSFFANASCNSNILNSLLIPMLSWTDSGVISSPSFKLMSNFSTSFVIFDKSFPKNSANKKDAFGPILNFDFQMKNQMLMSAYLMMIVMLVVFCWDQLCVVKSTTPNCQIVLHSPTVNYLHHQPVLITTALQLQSIVVHSLIVVRTVKWNDINN